MAPSIEELLALLAGGALDPARLQDDLAAEAGLVRELARLWELELDETLAPRTAFSAEWEDA